MPKTSSQSEIVNAYDEWAGTYDTDPNRTRDLAGTVLRQSTLQVTGNNVIEIGCGTGKNTEWLAQHASTVVALDFSEGMLRLARTRVSDPRVRFVQHDARTTWPFADSSADLVVAMLILEHIEHIETVFAEAARTLASGGELFICELHPLRQLLGKQARFTNRKTGEVQKVTAFLHHMEDYLNAGASAGYKLITKADWRDEELSSEDPPRLLSLHFAFRDLPEAKR